VDYLNTLKVGSMLKNMKYFFILYLSVSVLYAQQPAAVPTTITKALKTVNKAVQAATEDVTKKTEEACKQTLEQATENLKKRNQDKAIKSWLKERQQIAALRFVINATIYNRSIERNSKSDKKILNKSIQNDSLIYHAKKIQEKYQNAPIEIIKKVEERIKRKNKTPLSKKIPSEQELSSPEANVITIKSLKNISKTIIESAISKDTKHLYYKNFLQLTDGDVSLFEISESAITNGEENKNIFELFNNSIKNYGSAS